jgi:leucyl/phenylalanyl-tRNA--protein transferase
MGGDLDLSTLVSAYAQGIFPWFNDDQPVLWWSPDPRMVLYPQEIKISRSLRKTITKKHLRVSCNKAFEQVIDACALRGEQNPLLMNEDTWITQDMQNAYQQLHKFGYAHSIEVWQDEELVGGLYGVCLGKVFFGESMFSRISDASKVALVSLAQSLVAQGFSVIDCQVSSDHLFTLGAREIARDEFLKHLQHIDVHQKNLNFESGISQASANNVITKS